MSHKWSHAKIFYQKAKDGFHFCLNLYNQLFVKFKNKQLSFVENIFHGHVSYPFYGQRQCTLYTYVHFQHRKMRYHFHRVCERETCVYPVVGGTITILAHVDTNLIPKLNTNRNVIMISGSMWNISILFVPCRFNLMIAERCLHHNEHTLLCTFSQKYRAPLNIYWNIF